MRILRTFLVLTGVVYLLPSPPEVAGVAPPASDFASFCQRQYVLCETAAYVGTKIEIKVKYSLKLLLGTAEASPEPTDPMPTGSTTRRRQSTLRLEDLIPEWRGPVRRQKS